MLFPGIYVATAKIPEKNHGKYDFSKRNEIRILFEIFN